MLPLPLPTAGLTTLPTLRNPKPGTQFCRHNDRLALLHPARDHLDYWRSYWENATRVRSESSVSLAELGEVGNLLADHVPHDSPVLEAGCGPARFVKALKNYGCTVIGVDYEPQTIDAARQSFPDLDLRLGNVLALDFPSEYFGAYVSLGVVEHFENGPHAALAEARRVLTSDSVALISVPYLNPGRARHLERLPQSEPIPPGLSFHQYYFSGREFTQFLEQAGFQVLDKAYYDGRAYLLREHPFVSRFWQSRFCRERLKSWIRPVLRRKTLDCRAVFAHMSMYVCRPASAKSRTIICGC